MVTDVDWYYDGPEVLIGGLLDANWPEGALGPALTNAPRNIAEPRDADDPLQHVATEVLQEVRNIGEVRHADPAPDAPSHVGLAPN